MSFKHYVNSITTDNGTEFAEHKIITKKLDAIVYFAQPYASWEKRQIEYSNKLLRQYIPKKEIINEYNTMNLNENKQETKKKPFELFYKP